MVMNIIVAVDSNWGIGKNRTQNVVLIADRKYFRDMTAGGIVIVGRKTFEDFPGGKPLQDRTNIIISSDPGLQIDGAVVVHSFEELFFELRTRPDADNVFVAGGGSVYETLLPYCRYAYVTKIDVFSDADTFFPNLDDDLNWMLQEMGETQIENGITYSLLRYENKTPRTWQGE